MERISPSSNKHGIADHDTADGADPLATRRDLRQRSSTAAENKRLDEWKNRFLGRKLPGTEEVINAAKDPEYRKKIRAAELTRKEELAGLGVERPFGMANTALEALILDSKKRIHQDFVNTVSTATINYGSNLDIRPQPIPERKDGVLGAAIQQHKSGRPEGNAKQITIVEHPEAGLRRPAYREEPATRAKSPAPKLGFEESPIDFEESPIQFGGSPADRD